MVAKAVRRNKLLEFFALPPPCLVGLEAFGSAHHRRPDMTMPLCVVDASFFSSIGVVNPRLTIIANALRVARHIQKRLGA